MITTSSWGVWALSYPEGNVRKLPLPTTYDAFFSATFDNNDTLIVLARMSGSATTHMLFINPNTGALMRPVAITNCTTQLITELTYDSSDNMLYGGATDESHSITYDWVKVDPKTGDCSASMVPSQKGIVTCWAYDINGRNVWYSEEINNGFLLRGVNVDTNKLVSAFKTKMLIETMEIETTPAK